MTIRPRRPFLTADWRYLMLLNYEIDPIVLHPFVPVGTELDEWDGRAFVSMVGFQFLYTRVWGVSIPGHRNFEEVNLRFYVRHRFGDEWRRGVVFIKELVPRRAIAWTARAIYGENYHALRMSHDIAFGDEGHPQSARYAWHYGGREHAMSLRVSGAPGEMLPGSHEEFIAEHYRGYVRARDGRTVEYRVDHPKWRIWNGSDARFECDVSGLYGPSFAEPLAAPPVSAFLAEGSPVSVYGGVTATR